MLRFFLLFVLISSCSSSVSEKKSANYVQRDFAKSASKKVNRLFSTIGRDLSKKYALKYTGNGVSMFEGPVKKLSIEFELHKRLAKSEARYLLFQLANDFLNAINNDNSLQQFLVNKPFNIKNIQIVIFLFDENGKEILEPDFCVATLVNESILYNYAQNVLPSPYSRSETEDYEEAVKTLNQDTEGKTTQEAL